MLFLLIEQVVARSRSLASVCKPNLKPANAMVPAVVHHSRWSSLFQVKTLFRLRETHLPLPYAAFYWKAIQQICWKRSLKHSPKNSQKNSLENFAKKVWKISPKNFAEKVDKFRWKISLKNFAEQFRWKISLKSSMNFAEFSIKFQFDFKRKSFRNFVTTSTYRHRILLYIVICLHGSTTFFCMVMQKVCRTWI